MERGPGNCSVSQTSAQLFGWLPGANTSERYASTSAQ